MFERFTHLSKRITVFVGAYGSGKSEISVNYAIWLSGKGKVHLADLDMINPFYRSADARTLLARQGIDLIASVFAGTQVDVPAMPPEVARIFADSGAFGVLDIGGEDLGARTVASLKPQFEKLDYDLLMVVNPFRPFTDSAEKIAQTASALSKAAKLAITGLVYNANLLEFSTAELFEQGWPVFEQAARLTGLPPVFAAAMAESIPDPWDWPDRHLLPVLPMQRTIVYPTDGLHSRS